MPFKRIAINQGRQPCTLVKGTIRGRRSARGDFAGGRKWRRKGLKVPLTLYGAVGPVLMRLEVLY